MILFSVLLGVAFAAGGPSLQLIDGANIISLSREELLQSPQLTRVDVESDPGYGGVRRSYQAIPLKVLLERLKISPQAVIQIRCEDGFVTTTTAKRLLGVALSKTQTSSQAYLAVESPKEPWPARKPGASSAGPFYLIWSHPERSNVVTDEWPLQVKSIEVKGKLEELYPKLFPHTAKAPVLNGLDVFMRNCMPCHSLNGQGEGKIGPDLNQPMSPTEYFVASSLRKYIRDPQSVRKWAGSRMTPFPAKVLSERDLDNLISYLKQMAKERKK